MDVELVLLDAPVTGTLAASRVSKIDGFQSQYDSIADHGNEKYSVELPPFMDDGPTDAVHRASIHALRAYSGPGATAPIDFQVLYISARVEIPGEADLEEKRLWGTDIFPALRWEELQSTHEELW